MILMEIVFKGETLTSTYLENAGGMDYRVQIETCNVTYSLVSAIRICAPAIDISYACPGEPAVLAISNSYDSYQWYKDGVAISGATLHVFDITESGNYSVQVTLANGSVITDEIYVEVFAASIEPRIIFQSCDQALLTADVEISGETTITPSVRWYNSSGFLASGNTYMVTTSDDYYATLTFTALCPPIISQTIPILLDNGGDAGPGGESCDLSFSMNAEPPTCGVGTWRKMSGPSELIISDVNDPTGYSLCCGWRYL